MDFTGFPQETLDFLTDLGANNSRAWFEARRDDYERFYVEPTKRFVVVAGLVLRDIAPNIRAEPKILGSIFRINRDTRFSKDKRPYKDNIDFWFWEGERKQAVSGFFARISPEFVGIGAGCHGFNSQQLPRYRASVDDPTTGAELTQLASAIEASGYELGGGATKDNSENLPARLRPNRALFVHVDVPVDHAFNGRQLLNDCQHHWRQLAPLHRWLVDQVQSKI